MKCEIIKDLLPNYVDKLTSEESNKLIEEHLIHCKECKDCLENMKRDIDLEKSEIERDIRPFLKIKYSTLRKIGIAVIITAMISAVGIEAWELKKNGGISVSSDEVKMKFIEKYDLKSLQFSAKEENKMITAGYTQNRPVNGEMPLATLTLISREISPLGENEYSLYFVDENTAVSLFSDLEEIEFDEDDFIAIQFDDGVKTIKMVDLKDGNIESLK